MGYSQPAVTLVAYTLIARNGLSRPRRKKARVSAASLEQHPTAARAQVVAAELLVQFLVAVDDPEAPLDVGFAKGILDAAWTWFQKGLSSSLKSGRMAHLLCHGVDRDLRRRRVQSPTRLPRETSYGRLRFGVSGHDPSSDQSGSRRYANALPEFITAYAGDTLWTLAVPPLSRYSSHCLPVNRQFPHRTTLPDIEPTTRPQATQSP